MLDERPDLSPDLEWMLQSGQTSDSALVEALTGEYYAEIFGQAVHLLGNSHKAEAAAARCLADAVLNAHRYPVDLGLRVWLSSLLRERAGATQSPAADGFPDPPPAVLPAEIIERATADIHRIIAAERRNRRLITVQEILIAGFAILGLFFAGRWLGGESPDVTRVPSLVHTALVRQTLIISPTSAPTATPTPFPERAILYTAEAGDTLASLAEKTGLEAAVLGALNSLETDAPLKAGQPLMLGLGGVPLAHITPTPVTPAAPPEPLTIASDRLEIFQRIFASERYFHTLWIEALVTNYGPPGFTGGPKVKRLQAWISRPSFSLVLLGDPDGRVEWVSQSNSDHIYSIDYLTGGRFIYSGFGLELLQLDELVQQLSTNIQINTQLETVGIEQVAGREALVVDLYRLETLPDGQVERIEEGRYWVDTLTGVILRLQRTEYENSLGVFIPASETVMVEVAFDVDLPNLLFDPYRPLPSRFFDTFRGDPLPQGLTPASLP